MTESRTRLPVGRVRHLLLVWRTRTVSRLRPLLPPAVRRALHRVDRAVDPVRVVAHRAVTGDSRRVPPRLLRNRVGASTIESYFTTGERWAAVVDDGLSAAGRSLSDCRSLLDFGCGAGKVVRHLVDRTAGEVHGCDIHGPSIAWVERSLPGVQAIETGFTPPLPYSDARFDCIYAWSVFSHIDEAAQEAWLSELGRVLADDGVLLVSTLGEETPHYGGSESDLDRDLLRERGVAFVRYEARGAAYEDFAGTPAAAYGLSYVTRARVRERWSRFVEVIDILPLALDGQDVVVMRHHPSIEEGAARRGVELASG